MKFSAQKNHPEFTPIELTITIENQDEYDAVFALGNWGSKVVNAIREVSQVDADIVRRTLQGLYDKLDAYGTMTKQ